MPAFIAHMLICEDACKELSAGQTDPKLCAFVDGLKNREKYGRFAALGSLGPDLPYYASITKGIANLLFDRSDKPMGVDQWSYQLHSKDPNVFPLKMLEVIWRDAGQEWDEEDNQRLAFACGFLTHMAADQIIHPIVNKIAGPYYKSGDHRELHREVEVVQDICLYRELKGQDLLDAQPNRWCDPNPGWGSNTQPSFRYFVQKAFIEAHAVCPEEAEIDRWVDGFLLTLRGFNNLGPYKRMARCCDPGPKKAEYYTDVNYNDYRRKAVALSEVYLSAVLKFYLLGDDWDDGFRGKFREVVRNADLSAPMEKDILDKAKIGLDAWM